MKKLNRFYSLVREGKKAILNIFEDIWSESGLPKQINELEGIEEIEVHISSYGGDVSEGLAIYNSLKNHKAKVTTINDGFACSIASVIFCAGDVRKMNEASLLMIHNAWCSAAGNADDMRKLADDLDKITATSEKVYVSVSDYSLDEIKELMANETWLDPDKCLKHGFATEIIKSKDSDKSSQSVKKKVLELIKNTKQEDNSMDDPIKIGDFTVEEYDGGILIKKAEEPEPGTGKEKLTDEQVKELAIKISKLLGGNN